MLLLRRRRQNVLGQASPLHKLISAGWKDTSHRTKQANLQQVRLSPATVVETETISKTKAASPRLDSGKLPWKHQNTPKKYPERPPTGSGWPTIHFVGTAKLQLPSSSERASDWALMDHSWTNRPKAEAKQKNKLQPLYDFLMSTSINFPTHFYELQ